MKTVFTWRQLAGASAILFAYDVLRLSSQLLVRGLPETYVHVEYAYLPSLGLIFAHDVAFVGLILSLLWLAKTLHRALSQRLSSPVYARWTVALLMLAPFGVVLSAGGGLAQIMPRWLSMPIISGVFTAVAVAMWEAGRRLMDWLVVEDSVARAVTRLVLIAAGVGLLWVDTSVLRGLYLPVHFLWSATAVMAALFGLTYGGAASQVRPLWLLAFAGVGLASIPLTSCHLPMAHAGAVSTSVGVRQNAWIASRLLSILPDTPSEPVRPTRSSSRKGGLKLSSESRPHVLVVSVDGLRGSAVGFLGARRDTTPFLDRLATESLVYSQAYSPTSNTQGTFSSLLTNGTLEPLDDWNSLTFEDHCPTVLTVETLPMAFQSADYHTVCDFAYADTALACASMGCEERVDTRDRSESFARVLQNIRSSKRPIFGLIHLLDTHAPYRGFGSRVLEQTPGWSNYERSVLGMDRALARFHDEVTRAATRPVVWIITSDHGEALGEHGHSTHHTSIYEEQVHVPLLVKGPGIEPGRVETRVSTGWLYSTLMPMVDKPPLGPALPADAHSAFVEPIFLHNRSWYGVIDGRWKYIEVRDIGARWLFDLDTDPDETVNLIGRHRRLAKRLEELVDRRFPE